MIKIATLSCLEVDYYDDKTFWSTPEIKKLVKTGELISPEKVANLSDNNFAVIIKGNTKIKKAFPIYNKTASMLSAVWLKGKIDELPNEIIKEAEKNINIALDAHKVDRHIKIATQETLGINQNFFDLKANQIIANMYYLDWQEKTKMCTELCKTASEYGYSVDDYRIRSYDMRREFGTFFKDGIDQRTSLVNAQHNEFTSEMWNKITKTADLNGDEYHLKLLKFLSLFDKIAGLDQYYEKGLHDPAKTIWGIDKRAEVVFTKSDDDLIKRQEILEIANRLNQYEFVKDDGQREREEVYQDFVRDPLYYYDNAGENFKKFIDSKIKAELRGKRNNKS